MPQVTTIEKQADEKTLDYALMYEAPLEMFFFNQKQKDQLDKEKIKLESTIKYVTAVLENPEIDQDLDRAVAEGKIYSPAMTANLRAKVHAIDDGMGARFDLSRSQVNETGQFVLMSENCVNKLKIFTDGFLIREEVGDLLAVLAEEGVSKDKIEKAKAAADKYGAIILQRGGFEALKPMLEEALAIEDVRQSYDQFKQKVDNQAKALVNAEASKKEHGTSIDELKSRLAPAQPPKPATVAMTPQEIKREVTTKEIGDGRKPIVQPTPVVKPPVVAEAKPKAVIEPKPVVKKIEPVRKMPADRPPIVELNSKPQVGGLKSLDDVKTVEDLKRVEPAHLRQGSLLDQIKKLKAKIVYLAAVNKQLPVFALSAFEQSPLFRQYLKIGGAAITGGDPKVGYVQVMTKLKEAGEDVISLGEFEAIADLRKEMERL